MAPRNQKKTIEGLKKKAALIGLDVDALLSEIKQDIATGILSQVDSRVNNIEARVDSIATDINSRFDSIREMLEGMAAKEVGQSPEQAASNKEQLSAVLTEVVKQTMDSVFSPVINSLKSEIDALKKTQVPMTEELVRKYVEGVKQEVMSRMPVGEGPEDNHNDGNTAVVGRPSLAGAILNILGKLPPEQLGKLFERIIGGGQSNQSIAPDQFWRALKLGQALNPTTDVDKIKDLFIGTQTPPPAAPK